MIHSETGTAPRYSTDNRTYTFARRLTLLTLLFTIGIGLALVLFCIQPFWVDEWFIISSLKTKNTKEIFGQLNFMQQFPRVYLALIKSFSSFFNYSYFSLRFPSFLASITAIAVSWRVMNKLYSKGQLARYLFVLIIISSFTFTEYFVEMKQYPMDILASVVALWQLIALLDLSRPGTLKIGKYLFLCASFLIVPFFSYTYPVAIAPAYVVLLLQAIAVLKSNRLAAVKRAMIIQQWLPLVLGLLGIFIFYFIDAKQLATDKVMYDRWSFLIMDNDHKLLSFFTSVYTLFSQTGSGIFFENLFGLLGIFGFVFGVVSGAKNLFGNENGIERQVRLYSCLLIMLTLALYLCKKMPLGTPRLNAFTTPSIAILVIYLVNLISQRSWHRWVTVGLPMLLYVGVAGNVFTHYTGYFTSEQYPRQMRTYTATENAIRLAQNQKIPLLITPGVAYPYAQAATDAGAPDPAVWVLKTFPAYDVRQQLPVYAISDTGHAREVLASLPGNITRVLAGDGIAFRIIERKEFANPDNVVK